MMMPNRTYSAQSVYRYGLNGQEKDDEIKGDGNSYGAEYWQYDSRLGRRMNVDPKATVDLSVYSSFANNPIFYPDFRGDSIPTYFLDHRNNLQGNFQSTVPEKVQKMYNEEYGIKVGYNSNTHMLYYAGDYKTDKIVSTTARQKIINMLTSTYSQKKSLKNYGALYFGYSGMQMISGGTVETAAADMQVSRKIRGAAYINLDAIGDNLELKDYDYSALTSKGISLRTYNMARAWEHEFFGHVIQRRPDPNFGESRPGKVEFLPNLFRSEMGLPLRSNYGIVTPRGTYMLFGLNAEQIKDANYDYKNIKKYPYVLKSNLKNENDN